MRLDNEEMIGIVEVAKKLGRDQAFLALDVVLGRSISENELEKLYLDMMRVADEKKSQDTR